MKCTECGREIGDNLKFCKYCGAPVKIPDASATAAYTMKCKACGAAIKEGSTFCTQCGTPVTAGVPGSGGSGQSLPKSWKPKGRKNWKLAFASAGMIALLLAGFAAYYYVDTYGLLNKDENGAQAGMLETSSEGTSKSEGIPIEAEGVLETVENSQNEIAGSVSLIEGNTKNISKVEPIHPKIAYDAFSNRIIVLQPDGNIIYVEEDSILPCPIEYENAVAVFNDDDTIFILQENGKVVADYNDISSAMRELDEALTASLKNVEDIAYGQQDNSVLQNSIILYKDGKVGFADYIGYKDGKVSFLDEGHLWEEEIVEELKSWTDIKQVYHPSADIVLGVKSNGEVVSYFNTDDILMVGGNIEDEIELRLALQKKLNSWSNIKKIAVEWYYGQVFYGLQENGKIVTVSSPYEGESLPKKYIEAVENLTDVIDIAAHDSGIFALKKNGSAVLVYTDDGYLSPSADEKIVIKTLVADIEEIRIFEDGRDDIIVGLKKDGSVVSDTFYNIGHVFENEFPSSDITELSPTESASLDSQKPDMADIKYGEYILPNSNSSYLNQEDIKNLSVEELRIARNEIYARHGRRFQSQDLQEYFESKDWYRGTTNPSNFKESVLNDFEKKNVEFIKKAEENAPLVLEATAPD